MDAQKKAQEWNAIMVQEKNAPFLQTYQWGTFQEKRGFEVERFESSDGRAQAFCYPLFCGRSYWYIPYYPLLNEGGYHDFFQRLTESKKKSVFIRYEPLRNRAQGHLSEELTPATTLILTISNGADALLSGMHPKTRYNIGISAKRGVEIGIARPEHSDYSLICEDAIRLFRATGERQSFRVQTHAYFTTLFSSFSHEAQESTQPWIRLYYAKYHDTLLGAILVMYFGDTATYLYGGSAAAHREMMAPHALQWTAIQDALRNTYCYYDFWGIAPNDDPRHPWAGITRFKKGFGGDVVTRPGTFDSSIRRADYVLYGALRKARRILGQAQRV